MNKMLLSAAIFNWAVAASFILMSEFSLSILGLESSNAALLFLHFTAVLVFFFGVFYYFAAGNFSVWVGSIRVSAIAKITLAAVGTVDVILGIASWPILVPLACDVFFGILFLRALRSASHHRPE